jgi:hypothetical protein
MAKKINVDEIDESFIVAAVRKERVTPEIVPPPLTPLPAIAPVQVEQQPKEETPSPEPQKEEPRGRRAGQIEYESLFIRETDLPLARFEYFFLQSISNTYNQRSPI